MEVEAVKNFGAIRAVLGTQVFTVSSPLAGQQAGGAPSGVGSGSGSMLV